MAAYDNTRVYLNTRIKDNGTIIYRVPVPLENENFFFNQEAIKSKVVVNETKKESLISSVHLTNKRLIILSQSSSIGPPVNSNKFDTFEILLNQFKSLKTSIPTASLIVNNYVTINIVTVNNLHIKVVLNFKSKNAKRRESLIEYLKMVSSSIISLNNSNIRQQLLWRQNEDDVLPTYAEAITITNQNDNCNILAIPPPAYS